jgi:alanine dehydrogenase
MTDPIWITEQEVVKLLDLNDAIQALEAGLKLEAEGRAANMVKTHINWGHNNLHAIGATFTGDGVVGTKTWAHTGGGTCPLLILFDSETGALKAIIEAFALGQMRTGGISGVATKWLAKEDADEMALIGTGKQALAQLAAVAAVRPLKRVRVFSPRAESRENFIARARQEFDTAYVNAKSVEEAVEGAGIITTVTRAEKPFLTAAMVAPGTHINAVGGIAPDRNEIATDILARSSQVVVDQLDSVKRLSAELQSYFNEKTWSMVQPISKFLAAGNKRQKSDDLTVFKAMGMGVSDLALGTEIYKRALQQNAGRPIPQPQKAKPRLWGKAKA